MEGVEFSLPSSTPRPSHLSIRSARVNETTSKELEDRKGTMGGVKKEEKAGMPCDPEGLHHHSASPLECYRPSCGLYET
jgi:hypothetical protein